MHCEICGKAVARRYGGACKECHTLKKRARAGDEAAAKELADLKGEDMSAPERQRARQQALDKLQVTTETMVPEVAERLGVVTGQCALGMNIFRDFTSELVDVVGGRSGAYQKAIKEAKELCISEMKEEAYKLGADAVIAMDLDFNEITGGGGLFGGKSMIMVIATGTAVTWAKPAEEL